MNTKASPAISRSRSRPSSTSTGGSCDRIRRRKTADPRNDANRPAAQTMRRGTGRGARRSTGRRRRRAIDCRAAAIVRRRIVRAGPRTRRRCSTTGRTRRSARRPGRSRRTAGRSSGPRGRGRAGADATSNARPMSAQTMTRTRRRTRSSQTPAASENSRWGSSPAAVSDPICAASAPSTRTATRGRAIRDLVADDRDRLAEP